MSDRKEPSDFDFDLDRSLPVEGPDAGNSNGSVVAADADLPFVPGGHGPLGRMMDDYFLRYASYVICERAIPNLDDGLKPVQRRILHALHDQDDGRFTKVANIVGQTMQYHPHGDASITEALVSLVARGYLIEGQGNFGNIFTGDGAAAGRYIECRLTDLARKELFHDALTDLIPSYDGRRKEPVVLPARIPNLLLLGADGIAVGLSTRILPHNFRELIEAQIAILNDEMFALAPDFPQGGLVDVSEYDRGRGRVRVRARIEPSRDGVLVIRDIPFGTTTETLIDSIEDAIRRHKVPVKSIQDYTAEKVEIELILAPETDPDRAIQSLYAFTGCETRIAVWPVVIAGGKPVEMDVDSILRANTDRLCLLLKQDLQYRRRCLEQDLHQRDLVEWFITERIYQSLETCKHADDLHATVMTGLAPFRERMRREVTRADVDMLLGLKIRRISQFDIDQNRREQASLTNELAEVQSSLANVRGHAIRVLRRLLKEYGDAYPRRTTVTVFAAVEARKLTERELQIRLDREKGYLGHAVTAGDPLLECSSLDRLLLVWNDGRCKVLAPPDRLFVDRNLTICTRSDRDLERMVVYEAEGLIYLKRFKLGGLASNREYRCVPAGGTIRFWTDIVPAQLYVLYRPEEGLRIRQQVFLPEKAPLRSLKARGVQMTAKTVQAIGMTPPEGWDPDLKMPLGVFS